MALLTGLKFTEHRREAQSGWAQAAEFRRGKASWKRHMANNNKPREIQEQMLAPRIFRVTGFCAIGIGAL